MGVIPLYPYKGCNGLAANKLFDTLSHALYCDSVTIKCIVCPSVRSYPSRKTDGHKVNLSHLSHPLHCDNTCVVCPSVHSCPSPKTDGHKVNLPHLSHPL